MKMNVFGWMGLIIGCLGGLAGMIVAILAAPIEGTIFTIIFIAIFGGVFWSVMFKPMFIARKLKRNGVSATAKVLEVHDTGVTVNNSPQIKLLLEVNTSVSGTYLVETKQIISRLQTSLYQPGAVIPVIIDPGDKNLITIDYGESNSAANSVPNQNPSSVKTGPWAGIGAEEAQRRLVEMDNKNKEIFAIGRSCKAIVKKYVWLGIYVNGENPAVELDIEVLPEDRPAFSATTIGVIKAERVGKFQVGEEIYVKYDPSDLSRVTVEHS